MARVKYDKTRCTGCRACEAACKQENSLAPGIRWIEVQGQVTGEFPQLKKSYFRRVCQHCQKPACQEACKFGVIRKSEDNQVLIDDQLCTGCKQCVSTCPFSAMAYDEFSQKAGKCTMCSNRLALGLKPACVNSCMALALEYEE